MRPRPAFAGRAIPRAAALGPFRLIWLTVADTEEDRAAVMESAAVLSPWSSDGWPAGLTPDPTLSGPA